MPVPKKRTSKSKSKKTIWKKKAFGKVLKCFFIFKLKKNNITKIKIPPLIGDSCYGEIR